MTTPKRANRKEDILQALAAMLQSNSNGQRITTAALAEKVGVSEAALYRHFPSKARMYEGLIEFIEDTLLSTVNAISDE
ncbi:nucleoid occlusion factor SlmA, partial [Alishewanella sp. SMS9]|nr:nucleoid occlusion factor SlmA [Alishewanella sp. SMS9]